MLRQILATVICYALFTSSVLAATPKQSLKSEIDNLNFELSVVWDQKDRSFYHDTVSAFNVKVAELRDKGLSNSDIAEVVIDSVEGEQAKKEVSELLESISVKDISDEEVESLLKDYSKSMQSQGASFSGGWQEAGSGFSMLLLVAAMTGAIWLGFTAWEEFESLNEDDYDYGSGGGSSGPSYSTVHKFNCDYSGAQSVPIEANSAACFSAKKFFAKTFTCNEVGNMSEAYSRCESSCGRIDCAEI